MAEQEVHDKNGSAPLKVGLLTAHNPYDKTSFSGTAFHIHQALEAQSDLDVRVLGDHRPYSHFDRLLRRRRTAGNISPDYLDLDGLDWVLGMTASGHIPALLDKPHPPIALVTDATPSFLREFYGHDVPIEADKTEAIAIDAARLTIYSSEFMATRAIADFTLTEDKVAAVPFGANFDSLPDRPAKKPDLDVLNLLWVGSTWTRKGGDIALACHDALVKSGRKAKLWLVGDVPTDIPVSDHIVRVGYLDKNTPKEAAQLEQLFKEAHVFILPTRADCTPMVVAEANVYGTPVLITDTGGVPSLIADDQNGHLMPMEADGLAWADAVRSMTAEAKPYQLLSERSFQHAITRLTWSAWARDVAKLLWERREK